MENELSSLCRICHIKPPQYTCPRCSQKTCSLACSKRHKIWASCDGVRDPTVYVPRSQLATPAGIDHDYNFLHSIEHRIERAEKRIVEERGLVDRKELEFARKGEEPRGARRRKGGEQTGEACIARVVQQENISMMRAPKGMSRSKENRTTWSKNQKCVNWSVEWIHIAGDNSTRMLGKVIDKWPIGEAFAALLEEQRRNAMTEEEKKAEKKRKADEIKIRAAKRAKMARDPSMASLLQDPATSAWNRSPASWSPTSANVTQQHTPPFSQAPREKFAFYLLRPGTSSSYGKVLIPFPATSPLASILNHKTILEFPTIYVFEQTEIAEEFMLQRNYQAETGEAMDTDMLGDLVDSDDVSDDTSSGHSSSSSDEEEDDEDVDEDEEMEDNGKVA